LNKELVEVIPLVRGSSDHACEVPTIQKTLKAAVGKRLLPGKENMHVLFAKDLSIVGCEGSAIWQPQNRGVRSLAPFL
jgi:hypothetical protein